MIGDPVWLELSSGHKFLTLYTEAESNAKAGVIVIHGMGVHPDWGLIGRCGRTCRKRLCHLVGADAGAESRCQGRRISADL
jgi:hypothetical protein